ncbi:hypothetical protein NT2_01_04670 [Caenibius tardaugens NBRC 16725]|uniref:Uncharacterized protein n=1 Tax=Caenibius tardaugens NBRC 16725 TaxID=1219035 RepID=U2ZQN8_9SPHN|nr:hypothetical protein [Caenibius tardaugens]AZI37074.1 hypothetical protein EGO55_14810 [Caenibius tardaugens NBRC 16725]GAD47694.1 hypothetical protein NT2_01_04670 [Caenibius tardaugens NBRC 16725]
MATVNDIITAAYRESNLTGVGRSLTSAQSDEGLTLLDSLLPATMGQEVGQELTDLNIGGQHDNAVHDYVPENVRLILNGGAQSLALDPRPYDGQRLAVVDVAGNLSANPLTLTGNGRLVEGAASLVLNTNSLRREWFYRADRGSWTRIDALALSDEFPFPREFDDYFSILLAMRLNPRHGRDLAQSSASWLESQASRLAARYRRPRPVQDWGSRGLLGQCGANIGGELL